LYIFEVQRVVTKEIRVTLTSVSGTLIGVPETLFNEVRRENFKQKKKHLMH